MTTIRLIPAALVAAFSLLLLGAPASAEDALKGKTYHFGTHPARTSITFVSEADIETIHGSTNVVSGDVKVDSKGTSASGTLRVPVKSMKTGIDLRDEHLRSDDWLDAKKHPWITLKLVSATENAKNPKVWNYSADLSIKGVTKRITGTARISAIPARFSAALGGGSWVRVRASFDVSLPDYGIVVPQSIGAKVSKTWKIGIDLYGTTTAPKKEGR